MPAPPSRKKSLRKLVSVDISFPPEKTRHKGSRNNVSRVTTTRRNAAILTAPRELRLAGVAPFPLVSRQRLAARSFLPAYFQPALFGHARIKPEWRSRI
jgi:hypothetical protein